MEDWVTIKTIKKRKPKLGTREIAKFLGISRNTVKNALASTEVPKYKRQKVINPDIEPFKEYIVQQLENRRLISSRVLKDITSKGYKGCKNAFYRYVKSLNLKENRTFCPYETSEAEQGQFDWSPYSVVIQGEMTKIFIFSYILGFSRYRIYNVSLSDTQPAVFEAIEDSLQELGGTPERLQVDNAKCFITNASRDNFKWNAMFLNFCAHYGFKPTRSLPGHPWSKGKVERPFNYLEEHFIKGNQFSSFEDLIKRLKDFQSEVNTRIHSTTKQQPEILYLKEKPQLIELNKLRYVSIKEQFRKVTSDCLFSFSGSRYSVPSAFAFREVWIRVSKGCILQAYSQNNILIAEHKLSKEKGKIVIEKSHYKNYHNERGNWERMKQTFLDIYPAEIRFLDMLKTQKRINHSYHLTQILSLSNFYPSDIMRKAFNVCEDYNVYTCNFIKGYLESQIPVELILKDTVSPMELINKENKDEKRLNSLSIKRSLTEYKLFN